MRILKSFIILAVLAFVPLINAQVIEITLKDAINHAYKNSPNIVKTENTIEIQDNNIRATYGALLPDLKFNAGWTRTNQVSKGGTIFVEGIGNVEVGTRNETTTNYNLALRSDVILFDGLANYDRIDYAKEYKSVLQLQLRKLKQDVAVKILADYISVLKNQQIVVINQATLEDSRAQLESIQAFVDVGRRTLTDVYTQDVEVAQNELAVERSINNVNKSIKDLAFDANLPAEREYAVNMREFNIDIPFESIEAYVMQNSNTDQLVNVAIKNRYDYRSTSQNLNVLQTNIDITRSNLLFPVLSGFGSYSLAGDKAGSIDNLKVFTVGLSLTYPIFQGFQLDNQRQEAIINYRSGQEDLKLIENQINLEISKAILDLKSLVKQIEISERSLKSAEQNKLLAEESYRVGIGTLLDVTTSSTNFRNLLIINSNLMYDFIYAQKQLEYYQGILTY
jgi:outer membrane protein